MGDATIIGIDLAKHSFQLHGARADGSVAFRKKLSRGKVLGFVASQPRCVVAMEACGSSHYWGREIGKLGHEVKLVPPLYVKPFVKRQKNDATDAEAICEAASRPTMRVGGHLKARFSRHRRQTRPVALFFLKKRMMAVVAVRNRVCAVSQTAVGAVVCVHSSGGVHSLRAGGPQLVRVALAAG